MIPAKKAVGVSGSLPGESRRMTIDPQSMSHIMRILIDLYSDRELAVLRELSTNAIDSHIMAGVDQPIEVETPGPLANYLVIRDFGLGLSVEEIYDLFGRYGASSKRETNAVTGMLGLGSKSPLTYTNQFTMIATQNGVRATVSISRDEDGVGNLTVVDTCSTSDHNGVEIRIPAKSGNSFQQKAKDFFRFWKSGTVHLNGLDPTGLDESLKLSDDLYLIAHPGASRYNSEYHNYIIMGNVPYPVDDFLSNSDLGLPFNYSFMAYVPIGAVEPTPSREALQSGSRTTTAINQIKENYHNHLHAAIQKEIEQAKTGQDAVQAVLRWKALIPSTVVTTFRWQGKPLPMNIEAPSKVVKDQHGRDYKEPLGHIFSATIYSYNQRGEKPRAANSISLQYLPFSVFVTGYDMVNPTGTHQKKMKQWLDKQHDTVRQGVTQFYCVDFDIPNLSTFVDPRRIVSWDVVNQEKLPTTTTNSAGRIKGSFDLLHGGKKSKLNSIERGIPGDKIDQSRSLFYMHGNAHAAYRYRPVLDSLIDRYTIICLPENRINKFKRENPTIKNVQDEIKDRVKKLAASLTEDQKKAIAMYDSNWMHVALAAAGFKSQIADLDIQEAIRLSKIDVSGVLTSREQFRREAKWPEVKVKNPFSKYSLLVAYRTDFRPEVIRYMNNEWAYIVQQAGGDPQKAKQGV